MKRYAYLCGPMNGLTYDEAKEWRDEATLLLKERGWGTYCPMRDYAKDMFGDGVMLDEEMFGVPNRQEPHHPALRSDSIRVRDIQDVNMSQALLINVGMMRGNPVIPMTGSVCEAYEAGRVMNPRIPVVPFVINAGFITHPQCKSPWFGGYFTPAFYVHMSLEGAVGYLTTHFGH